MTNQKPMVSIVMITYGHEKYIEEAINGVFIQQTDFPVELIIANDCSPDSTDEVVENLLSQAPENVNIKYTRHESNLGMMPNFIWALQQAKGKYIALCEGDDYWTDPLKLQKQVDFLEENEDFGLICTNYQTTNDGTIKTKDNTELLPFDILYHNPIGTLTVVFRNELLAIKPSKIFKSAMGDYPMWLEAARNTRIMKLGDYTSFYRILQNSASGRNDLNKTIAFLKDALTITVHYLPFFDLTEQQKNVILRERYTYYIDALAKKSKYLALKNYFSLLTKTRQIDKPILKQIVYLITKR